MTYKRKTPVGVPETGISEVKPKKKQLVNFYRCPPTLPNACPHPAYHYPSVPTLPFPTSTAHLACTRMIRDVTPLLE